MNKLENILKDERYKSHIEKLKTEDLKIVVEDELKALELARKGISEVEPEKKDDLEYLYSVAHGMQALAKFVLEKRNKRQ